MVVVAAVEVVVAITITIIVAVEVVAVEVVAVEVVEVVVVVAITITTIAVVADRRCSKTVLQTRGSNLQFDSSWGSYHYLYIMRVMAQ